MDNGMVGKVTQIEDQPGLRRLHRVDMAADGILTGPERHSMTHGIGMNGTTLAANFLLDKDIIQEYHNVMINVESMVNQKMMMSCSRRLLKLMSGIFRIDLQDRCPVESLRLPETAVKAKELQLAEPQQTSCHLHIRQSSTHVLVNLGCSIGGQ